MKIFFFLKNIMLKIVSQRVIHHSAEIRQPSPLPGLIPQQVLQKFTSEVYTALPLQYPKYPKSEREPEADPTPTKRTDTKNPFKLKENHLEKLTDYILCANGQPWSTPQKYREMKESDDAARYQAKKKAHENTPPSIAGVLGLLIAPIVRHKSYMNHLLLVDFDANHLLILSKINALVCGSDWGGIQFLLPLTNMNYPAYGTSGYKQPSLNHTEAHRRILEMERAIADMVEYLNASVIGSQKSLRLIAVKNLADAYAVLFCTGHSTAAELISKVSPSTAVIPCQLGEEVKWLKDNRKLAIDNYLTELDWGLPLLGLFHSLLPSMGRLDNESDAYTVLVTIMAFLDKRASNYTASMESLLLYGANLTKYTASLQGLCNSFIGMGIKAGLQFTKSGRFHELDRDGKLLGSDGRVVSLGLDAIAPGREKWLLPFPMDSLDGGREIDKTDKTEKTEEIRAHMEEEQSLVTTMLSSLNLKAPPILNYAKIGNARVRKLFSDDSFELELTSILPPSASMPCAWYKPERVFAPEGASSSESE